MKFTESHEWIRVEKNIGTVGVTNYAQKELGDIVYVELPKVGSVVKKGQEAVVLESTKAAADVYAPVSGTIIEVNHLLGTASEMVNNSPEKDGWLFKLSLSNPEEFDSLMDKEAYQSQINK
ncbi:MAG: glycine cleavage system protein GcvH [Parachlamydiaceae bacterium]